MIRFDKKPLISSQYGIFESEWIFPHFWLGVSWLFIYLFSYPFFALPLLLFKFSVLQFFVLILPLVLVQIYDAKQQDERNLLNDFAGRLT